MQQYSVMVKPASSLCDLRCEYCFYHDVSARRAVASQGMMTRETAGAVIVNLFSGLEDGDALTLAFQGGEPTLAGLPFFRYFVETVRAQGRKVAVSYALQTNGMRLNEEWCEFLRENRFLVGISMDGYAQNHNQYRRDAQGKSTYARAIEAKRLMDKMAVEYNVLCTLTNALARHPQRVWKFILEEGIQYIQFTPCLSDLDGEPNEWGLTPQRFHRFYVELFGLWKQELRKGRYISVKWFDDLVNLVVRKTVTACGLTGHCGAHSIVEADGSVYPCDFYVLDPYKGGSLAEQGLRDIRTRLEETGFSGSRKTLPAACEPCQYGKICGGGCKRMASAMYVDEGTGFCGFQHLLEDIGQELCDIGAALLRGNQAR